MDFQSFENTIHGLEQIIKNNNRPTANDLLRIIVKDRDISNLVHNGQLIAELNIAVSYYGGGCGVNMILFHKKYSDIINIITKDLCQDDSRFTSFEDFKFLFDKSNERTRTTTDILNIIVKHKLPQKFTYSYRLYQELGFIGYELTRGLNLQKHYDTLVNILKDDPQLQPPTTLPSDRLKALRQQKVQKQVEVERDYLINVFVAKYEKQNDIDYNSYVVSKNSIGESYETLNESVRSALCSLEYDNFRFELMTGTHDFIVKYNWN